MKKLSFWRVGEMSGRMRQSEWRTLHRSPRRARRTLARGADDGAVDRSTGVSWTVVSGAGEPMRSRRPSRANPLLSDKLLDAKVRLHRRLIEEINLSALEKLPEDEMRGTSSSS